MVNLTPNFGKIDPIHGNYTTKVMCLIQIFSAKIGSPLTRPLRVGDGIAEQIDVLVRDCELRKLFRQFGGEPHVHAT